MTVPAQIGRFTVLLLAAMVLTLATTSARADVLDDVQIFPEGTDAVIRIKFSVRVQYLRHTEAGPDLVEIFFQIVSGDPATPSLEESRRIAPTPTFPGVTVTYRAVTNITPRRFTVRFSSPVQFRVRPIGNNVIDIVVPGAGKDVVRRPTPSEQAGPAQDEGRYAIRLESFPTTDTRRAKPVPSEFQDYVVFSSPATREGRTEYEILLGYFATADAAAQARNRLLQRFPGAQVVDLAQRREEVLRSAAQPALTPPPPPDAAPIAKPVPPPFATMPQSSAEVEARAAELFAKGRAALDAGDGATATDFFNQLLILPPNRYSQQAQELAGAARERAGEFAKARAEYELYLKLFPDGDGAQRVRKRLAALADAPAASATGVIGAPRPPQAPLRVVTGNVSQFYYGGKTRAETAFNTPTAIDRATFAATDQSALVTNVDLNARYRTGEHDSRFVFRDSYTWSFLKNRSSFNRLNAAFYDYRGLQNPLAMRLGRQTGLTGGLPGRFDGAIVGYALDARWRVNAVGGTPVEYPTIDSNRVFWGANVDVEGLAGAWNGNAFAINQQVDGILDRRAVGGEVRYFEGGRTLYSLLDYDVSYKVLNIAMLQGSWQTEGQTTFNLLLDRRRAPTLTTTNAIFGQGTTSVSTLLQTMTNAQVRQQALDVTAIANQALLGVTTPVAPKWQVGADARLTNVGSLPSVVVNGIQIPASPATGNIWSYAVQAIGSNLYSTRDANVFGVTYATSPLFNGWLLSYNNLSLVREQWTLEPSIKYYTQTDNLGLKLARWTPAMRVSYRVRENLALESEVVWESARTVGPTLQDNTSRYFFYVGYRFDI
jgi:tetratricopeptide (TPR) repeat protein